MPEPAASAWAWHGVAAEHAALYSTEAAGNAPLGPPRKKSLESVFSDQGTSCSTMAGRSEQGAPPDIMTPFNSP
jgi:hypothetical protein